MSDLASETIAPGFSERAFYQSEFRGRTLALAAPRSEDLRHPAVTDALDILEKGGGRVVLVAPDRDALDLHTHGATFPALEDRLEGVLWRQLDKTARVGVHVGADDFAAALRGLAAGLRFFKVVRLDEEGGLETVEEGRHSFVDLEELKGWLAEGGSSLAGADRMALWKEVAALLGAGLPAVNVCTAAGLTEELFTYSGVGTLFTRERYVGVRALTIDDYAAAADLVARGMEEGYLAPRSEAEIDRILVSGFGAFVEDHHLAGMGALLHWDDQGEISALYTLTRFLGEGVGQHLVAHAVERAASLGLRGIFACTTSERVASFFESVIRFPAPREIG
ncbi:MAG: GNAT family N-acetyltransferase [Deltaproteobacteria bacterium]|nr:GNAT family N-acetyltransferase [Deltaproteobacteria bacterium]